ncbi:MAG: response regulator transcription factor [Syntrophomonadaceae bacterium]|nr:response regulator transcription factor [Syntrophomonadaceae bacterium]
MTIVFEESPHFEVIENLNPSLILEQACQVLPEVIIWRIENEDDEGIIKVIKECPQVVMVLVVNDPNRFDIMRLMRMGISGCLPARLLPRQIVKAIELIVIAGISCFPRLKKVQTKPAEDCRMSLPYNLTPKEREILTLLCSNNSNQEIASAMCLAESTVKTHLHNIYRKLGVKKRSEAIAAIYQNHTSFPLS